MDDMVMANLIIRGDLINFGKSTFNEISSIYRFTNENMSSYLLVVEILMFLIYLCFLFILCI